MMKRGWNIGEDFEIHMSQVYVYYHSVEMVSVCMQKN